jgi:hypothetical protein
MHVALTVANLTHPNHGSYADMTTTATRSTTNNRKIEYVVDKYFYPLLLDTDNEAQAS